MSKYRYIEITWEEYRALNSIGVWTWWQFPGTKYMPKDYDMGDRPGWVNKWTEEEHNVWLAEVKRKFLTRVECDE